MSNVMPSVDLDAPAAPALVAEPLPLSPILPPYGRALLDARRNGRHPEVVHVLYGDRPGKLPWPRLVVYPERFSPGRFDWRVVAGVRVVLVDGVGAFYDVDLDAERYSDLFTLIGELVDARAYVQLRHVRDRAWVTVDVEALAWGFRAPRAGRMQWPSWWSDAREALQRSAYDLWLADQSAAVNLGTHG